MGVQGIMYTGMSHSISGRRDQGCKRITAAAAVLLPLCAGVLITGPPSARLPVVAWLVRLKPVFGFFLVSAAASCHCLWHPVSHSFQCNHAANDSGT